MENSQRLDKALVLRGTVTSRARAQTLIAEGKVSVNGKVEVEPDRTVKADDTILLLEADFPWVSRGGLKLAHALDHWHIDPTGKVALDVGASTGGFTDVLLARGVKKVYALDVGHDQLAAKLKNDPRVANMEGTHIADVLQEHFPLPIDLVVIDVSFISVTKVLPRAKEFLSPHGVVIALVKPQFEVGKQDIGKGVVKDSALHERVLADVTLAAQSAGFRIEGIILSPIEGGDGNKEFLMLLRN
jgi:23S rRNA (cytidine1920-2'-O)/16S rRNA (cytidine1409-2'-O)-methyltransferase